jgi:hypothetical protein
MHVYRNRRYEEEIVMLIWHKTLERRTKDDRNTQTENTDAGTSVTRSQIAQHRHTHTETNKRLRAQDMIQGEIVLRGGVG